MPDFAHAITLIFAVGAFVEVLKILAGPRLASNGRALLGLVLLASFAAVFTVRYSLWAHDNVIHDKPLDQVTVANLVTLAVLLFLVEVGVFLVAKKAGSGTVKAIANIGYNQPTPTKMPPVPGVTQPQPPTGDAPMPNFTGDNVHVDVAPVDQHAPLPQPDLKFDESPVPTD